MTCWVKISVYLRHWRVCFYLQQVWYCYNITSQCCCIWHMEPGKLNLRCIQITHGSFVWTGRQVFHFPVLVILCSLSHHFVLSHTIGTQSLWQRPGYIEKTNIQVLLIMEAGFIPVGFGLCSVPPSSHLPGGHRELHTVKNTPCPCEINRWHLAAMKPRWPCEESLECTQRSAVTFTTLTPKHNQRLYIISLWKHNFKVYLSHENPMVHLESTSFLRENFVTIQVQFQKSHLIDFKSHLQTIITMPMISALSFFFIHRHGTLMPLFGMLT